MKQRKNDQHKKNQPVKFELDPTIRYEDAQLVSLSSEQRRQLFNVHVNASAQSISEAARIFAVAYAQGDEFAKRVPFSHSRQLLAIARGTLMPEIFVSLVSDSLKERAIDAPISVQSAIARDTPVPLIAPNGQRQMKRLSELKRAEEDQVFGASGFRTEEEQKKIAALRHTVAEAVQEIQKVSDGDNNKRLMKQKAAYNIAGGGILVKTPGFISLKDLKAVMAKLTQPATTVA
jgi:hypothetical protein